MFFVVVFWFWRGKYFSFGKELVENSLVILMLWYFMYKIKFIGFIIVVEYMREVLINLVKVGVLG